MARSDLLVALVQAGASGDQQRLQATVEEMVAEEKAKQHRVLAERLDRAYREHSEPDRRLAGRRAELTSRATAARQFIKEVHPRTTFSNLLLTEECLSACEQLVSEQLRADLLRSYGIEPEHRVLLVGPPGNGKTKLAEAIAEALSVQMFVIQYDALVGHYLGETATRIRKVFEYARTTPCVLFFDEFDAIGKERGDDNEMGEVKRVVASLLMQMDDLPSYTVVVAASNHPELLDRAAWRRFQIRLELPAPGPKEITEYLNRFMQRFDEPAGMPMNVLANRLAGESFAEIEGFCFGLLRKHILAMGEAPLSSVLSHQLNAWSSRASQCCEPRQASKMTGTG